MILLDIYAKKSICFGCGPANKDGLQIKSFRGDDGLELNFKTKPEHQAFPGVVNGGIIGTLFDCHGNWAAAIALLEAGHYNKSIQLYEKCLTLAKNQNDWIYWLNIKLALTYIKKGEIGKSKIYYQISEELYNEVDTKHFWDLYKINKLYQNTVLAISYLDSSYTELVNKSNYYTNIEERNLYLTIDKSNLRIQKEWEKVN